MYSSITGTERRACDSSQQYINKYCFILSAYHDGKTILLRPFVAVNCNVNWVKEQRLAPVIVTIV